MGGTGLPGRPRQRSSSTNATPAAHPAAPLTAGERSWLDKVGIDWDGDGTGRDQPAA
jgi:hypothetical protein